MAQALVAIACGLAAMACAGSRSPPGAPPSNVAPVAVAPVVSAPLRVRWMLRGYFYAGSAVSHGLGGNATSDNVPRPLSTLDAPTAALATGDDLRVLAIVDHPRTFGRYDGFRVLVVNPTARAIEFAAQDSRIAIVHEAIDRAGAWAPIEYLPKSWCGNSYHRIELPAKSYWDFTAPHYDGSFATRLRIKLTAGDRDYYSQEFAGRIDPKQFTTQRPYHPNGIMDPYLE